MRNSFSIHLSVFSILTCLSSFSFAQGKKELRLNRVKSISELVTVTDEGKEITYKDSYTLYGKNGKVIEKTDFNPDGGIKNKETEKYDRNDNVVEETTYAENGSKKKGKKNNGYKEDDPNDIPTLTPEKNSRKIFKFDSDNNKTEETEYDANGNQVKKITYTYTVNGAKSNEIHLNANNKQDHRFVYFYNGKGLRVKKETYDGENKLSAVKIYTYEFY